MSPVCDHMCFVWSLEPGLVARMHSHVRRVDISCENDSCQSSNGDLVCQIQTSLNLTSLSLVLTCDNQMPRIAPKQIVLLIFASFIIVSGRCDATFPVAHKRGPNRMLWNPLGMLRDMTSPLCNFTAQLHGTMSEEAATQWVRFVAPSLAEKALAELDRRKMKAVQDDSDFNDGPEYDVAICYSSTTWFLLAHLYARVTLLLLPPHRVEVRHHT